MREKQFSVLLGGDFTGKTTLLKHLSAGSGEVICLTHENVILNDNSGTLRHLMAVFNTHAKNYSHQFSADFVTTCFHLYLVALRDLITRTEGDAQLVVDSYYYKILAKCQLCGWGNEYFFSAWRGFPKPAHVFMLDTSPETAWERARQLNGIHALESYSADPSDAQSFYRFQEDMYHCMKREVGDTPSTVISGTHDVDATAAIILQTILTAV